MVKSHVHEQQGTFPTISQSNATTSTENANHTHDFGISFIFADGDNVGIAGGQAVYYGGPAQSTGGWANTNAPYNADYTIPLAAAGNRSNVYRSLSLSGTTGLDSSDHTHQFFHGHNTTISGNTSSNNVNNNENRPENYTNRIWKRLA